MYPTLMNVFDVNPAMVAWVNNIYLITYASFILLGGRLGDFTNRKIVLLIAYLAIGVGAAISGAGQSLSDVIIGRALMGVGAGLLTPQSMAYISILFASGGRGTALGIWGAVAGIAAATGPIVTEIFLTMGDWRWVMWINIPIVLVCFLISVLSLPNVPGRGIKFWDTTVSVLCGACLAGIILGIQFINASKSIISIGGALFIMGGVAISVLIRNELKKKQGYILSPELWVDNIFLRICLISGLLGLSLTAFYLPLVFLLDVRMNLGPVAISMVMFTIALANALVGPFAGNLSDRMEPEIIIRRGLILFAIANALLGFIGIFLPEGILALVALFAVMFIAGAGTGLAFAPLANLAVGRAQVATLGRAAAFFNCARQISSALGGVIVAIVFDWIIRLQLEHDIEITTTTLRESSTITANATLACFLFIAISLSVAAYLSCRSEQELVVDESGA